jgi:hypothetical protein
MSWVKDANWSRRIVIAAVAMTLAAIGAYAGLFLIWMVALSGRFG